MQHGTEHQQTSRTVSMEMEASIGAESRSMVCRHMKQASYSKKPTYFQPSGTTAVARQRAKLYSNFTEGSDPFLNSSMLPTLQISNPETAILTPRICILEATSSPMESHPTGSLPHKTGDFETGAVRKPLLKLCDAVWSVQCFPYFYMRTSYGPKYPSMLYGALRLLHYEQ